MMMLHIRIYTIEKHMHVHVVKHGYAPIHACMIVSLVILSRPLWWTPQPEYLILRQKESVIGRRELHITHKEGCCVGCGYECLLLFTDTRGRLRLLVLRCGQKHPVRSINRDI